MRPQDIPSREVRGRRVEVLRGRQGVKAVQQGNAVERSGDHRHSRHVDHDLPARPLCDTSWHVAGSAHVLNFECYFGRCV